MTSPSQTLGFSELSGGRLMNEVFQPERAVEAYERMTRGKARLYVMLPTGIWYVDA